MTDEEVRDTTKGIETDRKEHPELFQDLMDPNNPNGMMMQQNQEVESPPEEEDSEDNRPQPNKDKIHNKGI